MEGSIEGVSMGRFAPPWGEGYRAPDKQNRIY